MTIFDSTTWLFVSMGSTITRSGEVTRPSTNRDPRSARNTLVPVIRRRHKLSFEKMTSSGPGLYSHISECIISVYI